MLKIDLIRWYIYNLQIAMGNLPRERMCWDVTKDKAVRVAIPFWHKLSTVLLFTLNFLQCCLSSSSVIVTKRTNILIHIGVVLQHKYIVIDLYEAAKWWSKVHSTVIFICHFYLIFCCVWLGDFKLCYW